MSHYKLLNALGLKLDVTKREVNLYHRYKDNDTDVITEYWIGASEAENLLSKVFAQDPDIIYKDHEYVRNLEEENRLLKGKLESAKQTLSE